MLTAAERERFIVIEYKLDILAKKHKTKCDFRRYAIYARYAS